MIAIAVIIIACPCALALATPVATLVGLSLGAKKKILFKEAAQLETMAKTDVLLLDKTGTITVGRPEVVNEKIFEEFDKNLLYSLVKSSNHPVACGIESYLKSKDETIKDIVFDEFTQIPASGIQAKYQNKKIFGGNLKLMIDNGIEISHSSDKTLFYFAIEKKVVAIYELSDQIKDTAKEHVENLTKKKIEVVMLIDEGSETGSRFITALKTILAQKPKAIYIAVPVLPRDVLEQLEPFVDDIFFLYDIDDFAETSLYYESLEKVEDTEIEKLLEEN
jgi:Cu+-exporting ATPase